MLTSKCALRHKGVHFFDISTDPGVLYIFTSKCASRHNGVHFLDISTSKSAPRPPVFNTFCFQMCFAPQRRTLFRHRNFQKWSENGVFCTFWLRNVLRATTACTFSTSQLPKVVRGWGVLYILTWKCASRHNGVQFFISHLASWLRTRRFSEPTFRPSGATNHWKNTVNRDFPTFSRISIFFLLTLSLLLFSLLIFLFSLPLPCSAFHLSILSEVWLLNFLRLHYITLHCIALHYITLHTLHTYIYIMYLSIYIYIYFIYIYIYIHIHIYICVCVCVYIYIYIHIHSTCISWFSLCCSFVVTRLQKIEILLILPGSKSWVQWNSAPFAMKKGHDPRYPQVKCRSLLQQRSSHDHHSSGAIANLVVLATKDGLSGRWDTYFAIIMGYIWYIWYIYIYIYIYIYMWRGPLCIEWRGLGKKSFQDL